MGEILFVIKSCWLYFYSMVLSRVLSHFMILESKYSEPQRPKSLVPNFFKYKDAFPTLKTVVDLPRDDKYNFYPLI